MKINILLNYNSCETDRTTLSLFAQLRLVKVECLATLAAYSCTYYLCTSPREGGVASVQTFRDVVSLSLLSYSLIAALTERRSTVFRRAFLNKCHLKCLSCLADNVV